MEAEKDDENGLLFNGMIFAFQPKKFQGVMDSLKLPGIVSSEAIEGTESLKILEQTMGERGELGDTNWEQFGEYGIVVFRYVFQLYLNHFCTLHTLKKASLLENVVCLWSSKMCGASSGICLIGVFGRGLVLSDESMMSTGMFEHHWGWGSIFFFFGPICQNVSGFHTASRLLQVFLFRASNGTNCQDSVGSMEVNHFKIRGI